MSTVAGTASRGWWAISGDELMEALRRVADGEDADAVYADLYANSEHEDYSQ